MPEITIDRAKTVDIEIRATTLAVFRFTAQARVPGGDFVDFATAKDSTQVSESVYRLRLAPPIRAFTDLRIFFLIDGKPHRPYDIHVHLSQDGHGLADPLHCHGAIGADGKMVFDSVEATLL